MHNLDRTMFETSTEQSEQEDFLGILGSLLKGETGEAGSQTEYGETGELEAAAELLEVRDEAELEEFIGDLFGKVAGAARSFAGSPTGQALGKIVKSATKQALPVVGRGVGGWISPRYAEPGARVATAAGDLLGLELEGLSGEDREFEVARALVRFAQAACSNALNALKAPPGTGRPAAPAQPVAVARQAAATAARQHAPGLVPAITSAPAAGNSGAASASGRWVRRGNTIVIVNP
jgi:hypothetical protein